MSHMLIASEASAAVQHLLCRWDLLTVYDYVVHKQLGLVFMCSVESKPIYDRLQHGLLHCFYSVSIYAHESTSVQSHAS